MKRYPSILVAIVWTMACGGTDHSAAKTEETAPVEQAVTNGNAAFTPDLPSLGVVSIVAYAAGSGSVYSTVNGFCSGTLLSNRWVLTARHCFCQASVNNPDTVSVSVYGSVAYYANTQLGQLYSTTAAQIFRHPTYDIALVKLNQTLPFYQPPLVYAGAGTDLAGKRASAWGFGNNKVVNTVPQGMGEALNWTVLNIDHNAVSAGGTGSGCVPQENDLDASGPWAVAAPGNGARVQDGDSGGPLFLEPTSTTPDLNQHVLVGVLQGERLTGNKWSSTYTGLWVVRDWIRTTAPDLARRSACPVAVPNSAGAYAPAVAEGPDGAIHIVAVQSNGVIGHWRFINGVLSKWGNVVGTSTSNAPAIGLEPQAIGLPRLLGLAYREKTTGKLKYVRWSSATWTVPIDVPNTTTPAAPAMGKGGLITYLTSANRVAATAYDPASNTFAAPQLVPASAPTADPSRRLSVVEDLASGVAEVGYRTTANEWVQAYGSFNCVSLTGSYWCNPDPKYGTDWQSAALAWVPGQRINLLTTRFEKPTDALPSLENRVVAGPPSWLWGQNRMQIANEPGVAQIGFDTFIASATSSGLIFSHGDNCFANDW